MHTLILLRRCLLLDLNHLHFALAGEILAEYISLHDLQAIP